KESLTASILPENASDKTVIWASSDEKVASVKDGVITGIKVGTANISATTKDGKKVATCKVSVKTKIVIINVKSISLNKTSVSLEEGSKTILTATVLPENASDKTVIWTSADDKIASVKDGEISGIKAGETSITASTKDGNKIATCKVSVSAPIVNVTNVYLNKYNLDLEIGGTFTLVPKIFPNKATNKKVKWTSDNTKVASVVDGKVTAIAAGKATITVSSEDGNKTSTCSVNVKAKEVSVSSVSLDKTKLELRENENTQLIATILPEDASNKKVKWTSSNENIATVVSDGTIYAKGIGECIITVTTLDGAKTATCNLLVKKKIKHVFSVSIDEITYKVPLNETKQITYSINPSDADNKEVKWTSSNPEIASIDEKGLVKAIKVGKTTITLTSVDGEKKNTCTVKVVDGVTHATGIVISEKDFNLSIGDSKDIYARVDPYETTNKSVKWSSDKPEVASVEDGTIKGISAGVATITATSVDGGFTDDIKVTVVDGAISVSSISLSNTNMNLQTGDTKILTASILPETASNKNLIWKSSDENIISFKKVIYNDMSIELTAKAIGNAEITVTSEDGHFTATCSINVKGETVVTEGSVNIKGRDYKTVTINGKTWLAENYAYLPKVNKEKDLSNDEARVYVLQYDGEDLDEAKASENYKKYGALYNYKAAIEYCPEGWHLATNEDWKELEKEAGMNEEDLNRIGRDRGQCADKFKSTDFRGKNTFKLNILESGSIRFSSFSDFGGYIGCYNTIEDKYMYRAFSSYKNTIDAGYLYNKSAFAIRYVKD
ncbi:MAG: Ig-like domain-containing protein, partial [Marinifilaceae bacterium]|nr:Ig-like domain-containing protein [Marinifilaceae bacterium]